MKLFVLFALVAVAVAKPSGEVLLPAAPLAAVNTYNAPVVSQYHSQDELGQYSYGYSGGLSAKSEVKSADGVTRGAYTFLDAEGKMQSVEYTADALNGFRAKASNMPVAPMETRTAPLPVKDTPEVEKARADFMTAFEEAKTRAAAEPEKEEKIIEQRIDTVAPVFKTVAPLPLTPIAAPLPILRSSVENLNAFSYAYSTPTFGYHPYNFGYPYYNYNLVRTLPVPFAAAPAPLHYIPQPVAETPEVAQARAEHLAAHAKAVQGGQ